MMSRIIKRVAKGVGAIVPIVPAAFIVLLAALWVDHARSTPLPVPSGAYRVGRATYVWRDEARINPYAPGAAAKQDLAIWIWYPAAATPSTRKSEYLPDYWSQALVHHEGFILGKLFSRNLTRVEKACPLLIAATMVVAISGPTRLRLRLYVGSHPSQRSNDPGRAKLFGNISALDLR